MGTVLPLEKQPARFFGLSRIMQNACAIMNLTVIVTDGYKYKDLEQVYP